MLPKIIVSQAAERSRVLSSLDLNETKIISFEGVGAKVDELRHWINLGMNIVSSSPEMSLLVWGADLLSPECQAVLLKPLEEVQDKINLVLVVETENGLLPTVLSRCVVVDLFGRNEKKAKYWLGFRDCLTKGPGECLAMAEKLEKEEMVTALEEVIFKLKTGLEDGISKNRLKILKLAIDYLAKLRKTNVNPKLAFGNFLISSWRLVKA